MEQNKQGEANLKDLCGLYELLVDFASYAPTDEVRDWYLRCANTIDVITKQQQQEETINVI
jgi:hypothetical protein